MSADRPPTKPRKPSRPSAPDCINPVCDRLADGPHVLTMIQPDRGPWYACGPECAAQWLRLCLIRVEARADRAPVETEAGE